MDVLDAATEWIELDPQAIRNDLDCMTLEETAKWQVDLANDGAWAGSFNADDMITAIREFLAQEPI